MDSLRIGKLLGLHEVPGCCFRLTEMTTRERQRHAIMPAQTSRPLPLAAGAYGGGLGDPEMRQLNPESPLDSATGRNDRLVEAIAKHPVRFSGFAVLPAPDPEAAASELVRCVAGFGFKGAMMHGRSRGWFQDYA